MKLRHARNRELAKRAGHLAKLQFGTGSVFWSGQDGETKCGHRRGDGSVVGSGLEVFFPIVGAHR